MVVHGMHGRVVVCLCGMGSTRAKTALMMRGNGATLMSCEVMTTEKGEGRWKLVEEAKAEEQELNQKKVGERSSVVVVGFWR